jgi:hypothetical protein
LLLDACRVRGALTAAKGEAAEAGALSNRAQLLSSLPGREHGAVSAGQRALGCFPHHAQCSLAACSGWRRRAVVLRQKLSQRDLLRRQKPRQADGGGLLDGHEAQLVKDGQHTEEAEASACLALARFALAASTQVSGITKPRAEKELAHYEKVLAACKGPAETPKTASIPGGSTKQAQKKEKKAVY